MRIYKYILPDLIKWMYFENDIRLYIYIYSTGDLIKWMYFENEIRLYKYIYSTRSEKMDVF